MYEYFLNSPTASTYNKLWRFIFFVPLPRNLFDYGKSNTPIIFDKNTVEFVTVAAEFCGFLERVNETKRRTFVDTVLKLLPLLYLKASLLPQGERIDEFDPETFVTEGDYERVRCAIAALMGEKDDYLDVFWMIWLIVILLSSRIFLRT